MSKRTPNRVTRRNLLYGAGGLGLLGLNSMPRPATAAELKIGKGMYESLGLRSLINARGPITIISCSLTLPEVKAAMDEASRHYVHIDELMEAVGKRLAELTGAEWAIVTTGAAGGLTVATCACVAGADPDKMELLPHQASIPGMKYEVVIPRTHRNVYDHSIRTAGVHIVEPANMQELEAALGPHTALVMLVTAAPDYDEGMFAIDKVAIAAHRRGVPVLVDAAAENLTVPNVHLKRGADLVSYSGGKCIRGPQCAGLLLGRKDLVQAAWINSAPHHTICRGLKAGKEEIVGMLAAVEMWMKRDHAAEEKMWTSWLDHIAARLRSIDGLTTSIQPPHGIDNRTPRLNLTWDSSRIDLKEDELEQILWEGEPRIAIGGKGSFLPFPPDEGNTAIVSPYLMMPGDEKIVAERLFQALSKAPKPGSRKKMEPPAFNLNGQWDVHLEFISGSADHSFAIEQNGNDLTGTHVGQAAMRELKGSVDGKNVLIRSSYTQHGARLNFTFTGTADANLMQGSLLVGEYGSGRWSANRHQHQFPGGGRPVTG